MVGLPSALTLVYYASRLAVFQCGLGHVLESVTGNYGISSPGKGFFFHHDIPVRYKNTMQQARGPKKSEHKNEEKNKSLVIYLVHGLRYNA